MATTQDHHSDPMWYLQELVRRFQGRGVGETSEDIVLEVVGAGKGWHGHPTQRQVKQVVMLLVIALQQSTESEVRALAATMLGELKRATWAAAPLIAALSDEDSQVRASAARALGELGSRRAVKPLAQLLTSKESKERMQTARAVDQMRRQSFSFNVLSAEQRLSLTGS